MRPLLLALALAAVGRASAQAEPPAGEPAAPDPVLEGLVAEALDHSPEYAQARAEVEAERARVPQTGAWPDPTLTLGIQNDGFNALQIGVMETSFWQVMVTQPIPFPGKLGLRRDVARAQATAATAQLDRLRLTVTADVERAYLSLLLVRGQRELQDGLQNLWKEAEALAQTRYQVGAAPQSDLIRAQLERTRLVQDGWSLEANEATKLAALNRLRGKAPGDPVPTARRLADLPLPPVAETAAAAAEDAERRSPELARARLDADTAQRRVALARKERLPDFALSAGIMPRGSLDPMWVASVGISIPLFSNRGAAVDEARRRREAQRSGEQAAREIVRLRATERWAELQSLGRIVHLLREGLLVQSEAAVRSTLSQYRVAKVPFASVLEVLRGYVNDQATQLDAVARAQALAIAQREVSVEPPSPLTASIGGGSVPGSSGGGMAAGATRGGGAAAAEAPAGGGAGMAPGM